MKHLILSILLLGFVSSSFAQQTETPPLLTEQDFLTLSRHQKTAARLLIGAATLGLLVTLMADAGQVISGWGTTVFSARTVVPEYRSYTLPYLLSAAALGGGITLFIFVECGGTWRRYYLVYRRVQKQEKGTQPFHLFEDGKSASRAHGRTVEASLSGSGIENWLVTEREMIF